LERKKNLICSYQVVLIDLAVVVGRKMGGGGGGVGGVVVAVAVGGGGGASALSWEAKEDPLHSPRSTHH